MRLRQLILLLLAAIVFALIVFLVTRQATADSFPSHLTELTDGARLVLSGLLR